MSRSNAKRRQTRPSGERWPPPGRLSLRICKHAVVSVASELGRARDQARQRRQNGGCYKSQARDVVSGRLCSPGFASPLDLGRLCGASSNAPPPWRPQRQPHGRSLRQWKCDGGADHDWGKSRGVHQVCLYGCTRAIFRRDRGDIYVLRVHIYGISARYSIENGSSLTRRPGARRRAACRARP